MKLLDLQFKFTRLVADLIEYAKVTNAVGEAVLVMATTTVLNI
jgi:hypothetical protein